MMTMAMLGAVLIVLVSTAQWDVLQLLHITLILHPDSLTTMMTFIRAIVYVTCVSVLIYGMYAVWVFRQWETSFSGQRVHRGSKFSPSNCELPDLNRYVFTEDATPSLFIVSGLYIQTDVCYCIQFP